MMVEQLDINMQKMNLDLDIIPFTKWVKNLNVKYNTIKLLEII